MSLNNPEGEVVLAFISDKNGNYPSLNIQDDHMDKLVFSFVGCQTLRINTEELFGYSTDLKVSLNCKTVHYFFDEKTKKYLIGEISANRIILLTIPEKEPIILERNQ